MVLGPNWSRSQGHKVQKHIEGDRVAGVSLHSATLLSAHRLFFVIITVYCEYCDAIIDGDSCEHLAVKLWNLCSNETTQNGNFPVKTW